MKLAKEEWLGRISLQIQRILINIDKIQDNDEFSLEENFAKVDCLQDYYDTIHAMPIWPYDVKTLSRFFSSIMLPILIFAIQVIVEMIINRG
jgi:hypothetical protein